MGDGKGVNKYDREICISELAAMSRLGWKSRYGNDAKDKTNLAFCQGKLKFSLGFVPTSIGEGQ